MTKTASGLFLLLLLGGPLSGQEGRTEIPSFRWGAVADLPLPVYAHQLVAVDGRLYALGGRTFEENSLDVTFEYEIGADAWRERARMPTGRANHAAVVADGRIHVLGGNPYKSEHEIYDPVTDEWSLGQPLPSGLQHLNYSAAAIAGGFFVFGGLEDGGRVSERVLWYDLETDEWEERRPLPSPRQSAAAVVFEDHIFVCGGVGDLFEGLARVDAYDPVADRWDRKADMPQARMVSGAAVVGDRIIVVAGVVGEEDSADVFFYEPHSDKWELGPPMPYPLSLAGVASAGGLVYVAGGTDHAAIFSGVWVGTPSEIR